MSIIIIEGPDGAGKSTVVKQLLESHPGATLMHFSNPLTDQDDRDYWKVYTRAIANGDWKNNTLIMDRSWYSDIVYGPIFRKTRYIDKEMLTLLENVVVSNGGGYVVYVTASLSKLWSRCLKRGEAFVQTKELLNQVALAYEIVMYTECKLPVLRIETGGESGKYLMKYFNK